MNILHAVTPAFLLSLLTAPQPTASFAPPQLLAIGPQAVAVVTGDLDGDGDLDLASCWGPYGGLGNVTIFKNNGAGNFTASTTFNVGPNPGRLAFGDLDRDGDLDLVKVDAGGVSLLFNNNNATFKPLVRVSTSSSPSSVALGDLDNDGDLDLVLGNGNDYYTTNLSILFNNGQGGFGGETNPNIGGLATAVITGDLDSDGDMDIAATLGGGFYGPDQRVAILKTNGPGIPGTLTTYRVGRRPYAITTGDLDQDGDDDDDLEIITANDGSNNVSVLLNQGATFTVPPAVATGRGPSDVKVGDFDRDGKPDLVTTNQETNTITVLTNRGLVAPTRQEFNVQANRPFALAVGDFNGDSKPDIATANRDINAQQRSSLTILLNNAP